MSAGEWVSMGMWIGIAWFIYASLVKKKDPRNSQFRGFGQVNEMPVARGRLVRSGPPAWLRQFSINPWAVVNVQRIDEEARTLETSKPEIRERAERCWSEGRCRSLEFTRFMAGEPLGVGMRLYFVHARDGAKEPSCYAFVAPERW